MIQLSGFIKVLKSNIKFFLIIDIIIILSLFVSSFELGFLLAIAIFSIPLVFVTIVLILHIRLYQKFKDDCFYKINVNGISKGDIFILASGPYDAHNLAISGKFFYDYEMKNYEKKILYLQEGVQYVNLTVEEFTTALESHAFLKGLMRNGN